MKFLSFLGAKGYAILAGLLGVAALILRNRYLASAKERAEHRRDVAEAGLRRKKETEEREAEIHSEWSDKERIANENISDIPEFLRRRRVRNKSD